MTLTQLHWWYLIRVYYRNVIHLLSNESTRPAGIQGVIVQLISEDWSYDEVSEYLKTMVGDTRGMSSRTLHRCCARRGICHCSAVDQDQLDRIVWFFCHYGWSLLWKENNAWSLMSQGLHMNQCRLAASLQCVAPVQYTAWCYDTNKMLNPALYYATYFGGKFHLDQN